MKKDEPVSKRHVWTLLMILVVALLVRVAFLSISPSRLTADELSIGYNAFSIFHTGKDEWGRTMPIVFQAFGDWKLPGYIYAAVPFVGVMGLSMISVKIPSVIAGMVVVWMGYLIATRLWKNRIAGYGTALVLALNPWPVHLSRSALESNLALAAFCVGFYWFLTFVNTKKMRYALGAGVMLAFTFYCYIAYRLLVVLFGVVAAGLYLRDRSLRIGFIKLAGVFLAVVLPLSVGLFSSSGTARFDQVSIFRGDGLSLSVNENRSFCYLIDPETLNQVCKIFFHKPEVAAKTLAVNYLEFLSPTFLFIRGDKLTYLATPGYGEFFFFLLPFFVWGLIDLFKNFNLNRGLLLAVYLLGPIPSALVGAPQVVRGSILILPVAVMTGAGLANFYQWIKRLQMWKFWGSGVALIALFFVVQYYITYYFLYPTQYDNAAYHVDASVSPFLAEKYDQYDEIYINNKLNDFYIFLAYYQKLDPAWVIKSTVRPEPDEFGFSHPVAMGKYTFGPLNLERLVCDTSRGHVYYFTDVSERLPIADTTLYSIDSFYNFSKVHLQANGVDVSNYRSYLIESGQYALICN